MTEGLQFYLKRASRYYQENKCQQCIDTLTSVINASEATNTEKATAYLSRGVAYAEQKKYPEAIKDYDKAINLFTDNNDKAKAYFGRGIAYAKQKKYPEALANFTQAIELATDKNTKAQAYTNRGLAYAEQKKYPEAIADFTQTIELYKDNNDKAQAHNKRGIAYAKQKKHSEAIADFTKAIELARDDNNEKAKVYYNRGIAYRQQKKYPEAIADYDKAIELYKDNNDKAKVYLDRGLAYAEQEKYDKAIADFTQAIELYKDNNDKATAYYNRGIACRQQEKYPEAIADYDEAIELRPDYTEAYWNRGNAYDSQKNYDEAKKDFQQAVIKECKKLQSNYEPIIGYKFRPINKNTIRLLVQGKLYFSDLASLNDPLECPLLHSEYKEIFQNEYEPRILSLVVPSPVHTEDNKSGLHTELINNTLLFSHYADSHKGICIEYEIQKELLEQAMMLYTPVQYSTNTQAQSIQNLFAIKDEKWKYENEARFIAFGERQKPEYTGNIYKGVCVKNIIFGLKTPEEDKALLYTLLHSSNAPHLKTTQFFNTTSEDESFFTLVFTKYEPQQND